MVARDTGCGEVGEGGGLQWGEGVWKGMGCSGMRGEEVRRGERVQKGKEGTRPSLRCR